jgi:hypothetical protein
MKRPIDLQREGAAFMNVGSPDDLSPITSMIVIGKIMHVVKPNSIYEVRLADSIDPERTNPSVPNTQQKILNEGSDSEVVGRILLTANTLFKTNYLPKNIDCDEALQLSFEALKDIIAMREVRDFFRLNEQESATSLRDNRNTDRSVLLPSIKNLPQRCGEFLQKADHSLGKLYSVIQIFYPKARKPYFEGFSETLVALYGATDPFAVGVRGAVPFLKFVRDARNCVEHPKPNHKIVVKDFQLDPSGKILAPTIEVIHPRSPQNSVSVAAFMNDICVAIVGVFESMIAGLCSKHVTSGPGQPFEVVEIPDESLRREKFVRYSYGLIDQDGRIIPIG